MARKPAKNNKTEHVLNLLTARKEPEKRETEEDVSKDIREQLEEELKKEQLEDAAAGQEGPEKEETEKAGDTKEQIDAAEPERLPDAVKAPDPGQQYFFYNVMEDLVGDKVEENLVRFGACTCARCKADAMALALNHLSPKYLVLEKQARMPMHNFYEKKYTVEILVALVQACIQVAKHPNH